MELFECATILQNLLLAKKEYIPTDMMDKLEEGHYWTNYNNDDGQDADHRDLVCKAFADNFNV